VRGDFVVGAETSTVEQVDASAKEILRHLG
jgi:hypothetical protein